MDRRNTVLRLIQFIYMIDSSLGGNKKGQAKNKFDLSCKVVLSGQFSNHFLEDLRKLVSVDEDYFSF